MVSTWFTGVASLGAGGCGGLLSGLFGIGGGIVLIPLLALALNLNQHQAQGVALAAMLLPNGLPAVLYMRRQGIPIHWPLVWMATLGFLPAVWAGAAVANHLPERDLRFAFAGVLALLAARTLLLPQTARERHPSRKALSFRISWLPGLVTGLAGGLASGLLGIGGAILMIPLMIWMLKLPQHEAQATSLVLMLAPIGLPGVVVYARSGGGLPWLIMAGVAVGFMIGAYGGARLATRILGPRLRKSFAVFMLVMAALLLMRGF